MIGEVVSVAQNEEWKNKKQTQDAELGRQDSLESDASELDESLDTDTPLDKAVLYAFDEACQKLDQNNEVEPFTVIISGDNLYVESHSGSTIDECFDSARKTIALMNKLADAYVFCYDGYVTLDDGTRDALIAERAQKHDVAGEAFALLYNMNDDGSVEFEEAIYNLGEVASLFCSGEFEDEELFEAEELKDFDKPDPSDDEPSRPDSFDVTDMEFIDMAMTDDIEQAIAAMSDD